MSFFSSYSIRISPFHYSFAAEFYSSTGSYVGCWKSRHDDSGLDGFLKPSLARRRWVAELKPRDQQRASFAHCRMLATLWHRTRRSAVPVEDRPSLTVI